MNEKATTTKRQATKLVEVVMLTNIPKMVGSNMKNYGPFQTLDIAKLPAADVKALLSEAAVCLPFQVDILQK